MSAQWPSAVSTSANLYTTVNLLQTTLASTINNAVTTIPLTSTTGFPTAGAVTIDNEVIFYTGISGGNLTGCTRGSDGTSAASHNSGVPVGATVVAYHVNSLNAEVIAIETDLHARFGFGSSTVNIPTGVALTVVDAATFTGGFTASTNSSQVVASGESKFIIQANAASQSATLQLNAHNATAGQCTIYMGDSSSSTKGKINYDPTANKFTIDTNSVTGFYIDSSQNIWTAVGGSNNASIAKILFPTDSSAVRYAAIQGYREGDAANISLRFYTMAGDSGGILERVRIENNGQTLFSDGTQSLPGLAFLSDTNTGFFRVGSDEMGAIVGGTQCLDITTGWLGILDGSLSRPGLLFQSDPGTGFYRIGASNIGVVAGGTKVIDIGSSSVNVTGATSENFYVTSTSASGVQIRILSDTTNAAYIQTQSNHPLHFTTNNGADAMVINTSQQVEIPNTKLRIGPTGSSNQAYPIVQVVTGTSTTLFSTSSSTFQTTNLSVSITPKFSSSKILIIATGSMGANLSSKVCLATIARGGSNIMGTGGGAAFTLSTSGMAPVTLQVYDAPGSTSAQTYAVQIRNFDNTTTINFGAGTSPEITQTITAIELAQ